MVGTGTAHGAAYELLYGRRQGGYCLTAKVATTPEKVKEVCGLAFTSIDGFGFLEVDPATEAGLFFGTVPDFSAGALLVFDDPEDPVRLPGAVPLDKTHPIKIVTAPTDGMLYGKPFTFLPLNESGDGLLTTDPVEVPALTEAIGS